MVSRTIPEFVQGYDIELNEIRGVYLEMLRSLCDVESPECVLLTDGKYGAAFFEHRYLSELLGIPLVEGRTDNTRMTQSILDNPDVFIAQETLDFSNHMIFNEATGTLEPRRIDLRVFAIQDGNGKVTVFPGGLTRVARPAGRITNNPSGGLCKPTWVVK